MWEVVTRRVPWEGLTTPQIVAAVAPPQPIIPPGVTPEVAELIRTSVPPPQRLEIPDGCPAPLAALMRDCWAHDPAARPTFADIVGRLKEAPPPLPEPAATPAESGGD